jgi:formate-dependent nitrite reductase membrane component NrfD
VDPLQAHETPAYGRRGRLSPGQPPARRGAYSGATYYGRPALKPSDYGELVAAYLFIGGIAGAAQVIATTAELADRSALKDIVRSGRYLAVAGAIAGPAFLIADLRTPQRWYNMLRIFRATSTMSIGAWTLAAFGATSALALAADLLADGTERSAFRCVSRIFSLPAAATGAIVATYTGTLLSATSTPIWAEAHPILPVLFGASATATSTAAMSLLAHRSGASLRQRNGLRRLAFVTTAAEWLLSRVLERRLRQRRVAQPLLASPAIAKTYRGGYLALGIVAPAVLEGLGWMMRRRSRTLSVAAALATLAGGYLLRSVLLSAGKASALRPVDYFTNAQR